jgi:hypothetical protein
MDWPASWAPVDGCSGGDFLTKELQRELSPGHAVFGLPITPIARRRDQDDVLFSIQDGTGRVAIVHLTWKGSPESPPFPWATLYRSFADWRDAEKSTQS